MKQLANAEDMTQKSVKRVYIPKDKTFMTMVFTDDSFIMFKPRISLKQTHFVDVGEIEFRQDYSLLEDINDSRHYGLIDEGEENYLKKTRSKELRRQEYEKLKREFGD